VLDALGLRLAPLLFWFGGRLWFVLLDEIGLKGGLAPRFCCREVRGWCVAVLRSLLLFCLGCAGAGLFCRMLGRFGGLLLFEVYGRIVELKACCCLGVKTRVVP
jgi:hypothetical protein